MRTLRLVTFGMLLSSVPALAQPAQPGACAASEALVSIAFRFKDSDAQSEWVYKSLRPMLVVEQRKLHPTSSNLSDGTLYLRFCAPMGALRDRIILTAGPRNLDLVARPITKEPSGAYRMTEIVLVDQPRPDWVILKSIERLAVSQGGLPSFDIEFFNFGAIHSGGRVQYRGGSAFGSCMINQPGSRVTVQVSLSGQRLRVASSDPEYPEELVERSAEVRSGYCGDNFSVTADFGPTGRIPQGPTRIRYVLKSASSNASGTRSSSTALGGLITIPNIRLVGGYFSTPNYQIEVAGDGIWSR